MSSYTGGFAAVSLPCSAVWWHVRSICGHKGGSRYEVLVEYMFERAHTAKERMIGIPKHSSVG